MCKLLWIALLAGFTVAVPCVWADTEVRNVQIQLKNRGFYYGEADGVSGSETEAALRRFQIRNGLSVTGTMTDETALALNRPPSASAPRPGGTPPETTAPPAEFRETDREFLQTQPRTAPAPTPTPRYLTREEEREQRYNARRYASPRERYSSRDRYYEEAEFYDDRPGYVAPPVSIPHPDGGDAYSDILRGTIYENASRRVQRDVVRNAQIRLARLRYYEGEIDGLPGPGTENALAGFQDDGRRRVTGRLDMATLSDLGLLERPRRPTLRFGIQFGDNRVFRGIEISP